MVPSHTTPRRAMTLVELLVVLGVIGLLMAILLPAVQHSREMARRANCLSHLRQIGLAMQTYVDRQGARGIFPYAAVMPSASPDLPPLMEVLGPFIEDSTPVYACPSDTKWFAREKTSYEYPASRLAGKNRQEVRRRGETLISSSDIWLSYDFETFHGRPGVPGSRNFVYLDGHAQSF